MADTSEDTVPAPRPPSFLDALAPVLVLIGLLTLTIVLFGTGAADGPLQVALFTSAVFAGLVAFKNGYTAATLREAAIGGISSAMGALFILLAVGALIGTWNMAGTIPTVVSYGIAILKPAIFYAAVALICAVVGAVTGSSWTTAGTLGVAFIGMAPILGLSTTIAAGAIISGAYMGDKMSPLSETTVLVPSLVGGVTVNEHIRGMLWTVVPSFVLAFVVFVVIGVVDDPATSAVGTDAARDVLATAFNISPVALLPLVLLIAATLWRVPPFLAIYAVALFSGVLACFTQRDAVEAFVDEPGQGTVLTSIEAIYQSMATGFVSASGNETIDELFSRGGMSSMLTTVWLILGAMCFAAIMEEAGFLNRLITPLVRVAHSDRALISSVAGTAIGLNVVAGDQYVADVLPSRVYRAEFARRGLAPRMLSRTVEDTGTVTSPLVPWNSCGAYMTGVLGVPTIEYLPFAFFNLFNPFIALAYAFTGFRIERLPPAAAPVIDGNGAVPKRNDFLHSLPKETVMSNDVQATGDDAVDGEPVSESVEPRKSRFTLPSAYTILFALIVLMAIATWIIPAGQYALDEEGSPIPGTYQEVESSPSRIIVDSLEAPINGLYGIEDPATGNVDVFNTGDLFGAIDVALFILVIGGFIGITMKTGAIQAGIALLVNRLGGRERWMIPILMTVFAVGGTTFGMAEESLAFYVLIITVMIAAGYDALVGALVILLGAGIGVLGSTVNPFATGIASGFADVPISDGLGLRLVILIVGLAAGIWFVLRYADRVKRDPSKSLVYDMKEDNERHFAAAGADTGEVVLTGQHKLVLGLFGAAFAVMVYGVIPWEDLNIGLPTLWWWFPEMTASFLLFAILIGLVARMREGELTSTFVDGARDLLGVALIIGIARGITVVMNNGQITDTVLYWAETALGDTGEAAFAVVMYLLFLPLSFLIPSTSGLATVSMPIMAPLAEFTGVNPSLVVTAYQSASGLINLVTPTSAVVMGGLAIARVPYGRYLRFVWPLLLILGVLTVIVLTLGAL